MAILFSALLFSALASAHQDRDCSSLLQTFLQQRYVHPDIARKFTLDHTTQMFRALIHQECQVGPAILERTIPNSTRINTSRKHDRINVVIRLWNDLSMEVPVSNDSIKIPPAAGASISLSLYFPYDDDLGRPVSNLYFSQKFIKRKVLLRILKRAANLMGPSSMLRPTILSTWQSENLGLAANEADTIFFRLDGASHAEFETLANLLAEYLAMRSPSECSESEDFDQIPPTPPS
ncbi:MAG: hypothetical protein ACXVA9_01170 [Bdellovibrionales bacterium]